MNAYDTNENEWFRRHMKRKAMEARLPGPIACGYCKREKTCDIRAGYMASGKREAGGTATLASRCKYFEIDPKCTK